MRDDTQRLADIQEAIERIEKYTSRGKVAFENDELIQSWVVRHLQIIGEAVRGLSASFCAAHPEVEWRKIVGMRNILVHDYLGIDIALVWSVVENDLPVLREQVRQILEP